jgi:membrane associated rhomboid family serine protease
MTRASDPRSTERGSGLLPGAPRATYALAAAALLIFIVAFVLDRTVAGFPRVLASLGFSMKGGIAKGLLFEPFTYPFVHLPSQAPGLVWSLALLVAAGSALERRKGARGFIACFIVCGLGAAACHAIAEALLGDLTSAHGAAGAALGVVVLMALTLRGTPVILFDLLPIDAIRLGGLLLVLDGAFLWLSRTTLHDGSLFVHGGGALTGALFAFLAGPASRAFVRYRAARAQRRNMKAVVREADDEKELDRILDKIHRTGMGSLTRAERGVLKRSSARYQEPRCP